MKIIVWDEARTKQETQKRYRHASEARIGFEDRWVLNERTVYSTSGAGRLRTSIDSTLEVDYKIGIPAVDGSDSDLYAAYVFKNFRFIHAQMSANPPAVAMRPQTSDQDDHRKADAADRISRWALRHYSLQEKQDQMNLHALLYGTGIMKTVWDSTKGDIVDFDEEKGEINLEGDISISVPFIWNIFLDPDAKAWDECKYVFERVYMDYEEACARWPGKEEFLQKARIEERESSPGPQGGRHTALTDKHYNAVELLEYWETGTPTNGYLGRYCVTTLQGDVIEPCRPSPFRFRQAGAVSKIESQDMPDEVKQRMIEKLPQQAQLPYHILTDIDIPNVVWGKSAVEYATGMQGALAQLDSAKLDNMKAHGVARMILPEATEVSEDSLGNSPWDITKITGNQPPYFMSPPQLMPEMTSERQNYITGINDVMGVNESMFGQQSREQSGASMQYATNQGNMIRRRLFNKYVICVESVYKSILNLVRKHWTVERTIHVLGKEKALEAIDIKGADIDGGYDVVGEYGVTLSLDPITRREEILTMQPLFEKAGVPMRTALKMLKLNELESLFDDLDLAENRQKEIFDEMIATGTYIEPKKFRDHENMIAWAMHYFMTQEFEALSPEAQALCEAHIEARAQLAAIEKSGGAGAPPPPAQPPGPIPGEPAGPVPAPAGPPGPQP